MPHAFPFNAQVTKVRHLESGRVIERTTADATELVNGGFYVYADTAPCLRELMEALSPAELHTIAQAQGVVMGFPNTAPHAEMVQRLLPFAEGGALVLPSMED